HSYAWLAVGRFDPPVVALPSIIPNQVDKRQLAAADLARELRLTRLEPKLAGLLTDQTADADSRAAAAKALAELAPEAGLQACGKIISDGEEPPKLREKVSETLGQMNSAQARSLLVEALRTAPHTLQAQFGLALASTTD